MEKKNLFVILKIISFEGAASAKAISDNLPIGTTPPVFAAFAWAVIVF